MAAVEKISEEQIEILFAFCRKHYVQYYDVQIELVDHLANAIEDEINKNPVLSFDSALEKVYAGFGYAGFAHIVDAQIKSMSKTNSQLRKRLFYSYFTWPKAAMMVCLFLLISLFQRLSMGEEVMNWLGPIMLALIIYENRVNKKIRQQVKSQKHPLLVTSAGMQGPIFSAFIIYNLFSLSVRVITDPGWYFIVYEFLAILTVISIAALLAYRDHIDKLLEHAEKEYPAAFS